MSIRQGIRLRPSANLISDVNIAGIISFINLFFLLHKFYQHTGEVHLSKRQKLKYDKEHKDSLEKYPEMRERMYKLLNEGRQHDKMQSRGKWRKEEI